MTQAAPTPLEPTARVDDVFLLDDTLTDAERALRDRVRAFGDEHVLPIINDYWERAQFPFELVAPLGELGVVGEPSRAMAARDCRAVPRASCRASGPTAV
jgi:hypothetical protein